MKELERDQKILKQIVIGALEEKKDTQLLNAREHLAAEFVFSIVRSIA